MAIARLSLSLRSSARSPISLHKTLRYSSRSGDGNKSHEDFLDPMTLTERKDGSKSLSNRPFTLPPGQFKPKQSLGQNFLSDQNYVNKICDTFHPHNHDDSIHGHRVVEIGPGPGALSRVLYPKYPNMTAIEIDQRAVAFLNEKLLGFHVIHQDVLTMDWKALAVECGGPLRVIANLPYYIVSQVLFSMVDACSVLKPSSTTTKTDDGVVDDESASAIDVAVVTMQLEVAKRITAKPNTKEYGIPSVVFQLYSKPTYNFKIPPTVFFPRPDVDSALITLDFRHRSPLLESGLINPLKLRKVLNASFQKRRKMLRVSLKDFLLNESKILGLIDSSSNSSSSGANSDSTGQNNPALKVPDKWATRRPESLSPTDFLQLTLDIYGDRAADLEPNQKYHEAIWRKDITRDSRSK
jgi:16S rRNA (adenine1518-N6/adenine1519-N6)-dimethyltransferase